MNNVTSPLSHAGDIHSIRCALQHVKDETFEDCKSTIGWLNWSKKFELSHQNRATVITMINAKVKKLEKKMEELKNG